MVGMSMRGETTPNLRARIMNTRKMHAPSLLQKISAKEVHTMNIQQDTVKHAWTSHSAFVNALAPAGFVLAALSGGVAVLSGVGSRLGWWYFGTGFSILRWAAVFALVGAIVSLLGGITARPGIHRRGFYLALAGLVIGLVVAGIPWSWLRTAQHMPHIYDITTDPQSPPQFVSIMPLRSGAENPATYGGPSVAAMQKTAYPDIRPMVLSMPVKDSFNLAIKAAHDMGWQIVADNPAEGRIEAVATTFWFGFKDDVVVRVSPMPTGSRIDMRSASRVGGGDVGTNAKRVRAYMAKLASMSGSEGDIGY